MEWRFRVLEVLDLPLAFSLVSMVRLSGHHVVVPWTVPRTLCGRLMSLALQQQACPRQRCTASCASHRICARLHAQWYWAHQEASPRAQAGWLTYTQPGAGLRAAALQHALQHRAAVAAAFQGQQACCGQARGCAADSLTCPNTLRRSSMLVKPWRRCNPGCRT